MTHRDRTPRRTSIEIGEQLKAAAVNGDVKGLERLLHKVNRLPAEEARTIVSSALLAAGQRGEPGSVKALLENVKRFYQAEYSTR